MVVVIHFLFNDTYLFCPSRKHFYTALFIQYLHIVAFCLPSFSLPEHTFLHKHQVDQILRINLKFIKMLIIFFYETF